MSSLKEAALAAVSEPPRADDADAQYRSIAKSRVIVYCREVLQREPGAQVVHLMPKHTAESAFTIDGMRMFCSVDMAQGRCHLEVETECSCCSMSLRRGFASLAGLGWILQDAQLCASCERNAINVSAVAPKE